MSIINLEKRTYIDLESPATKDVSPYDSDYPIQLLVNGLKTKFEQTQNVVKDVYRAVAKETPAIAQAQQSLKKGYRYVVDASDSTLKAIESGKIKLSIEKNGKTFAQIKNNGKYGSKLPIKKEYFKKGIDPVQMANALQMRALQDQIQEIAIQIDIINHSVREVLQGQQNDRIGLYYSGMSLYLESRHITDNDLKNLLVSQSLRALSESTSQLVLTMQSDIKYLTSGDYKSAKGKKVELIDDHMHSINLSFEYIHQATMLRAGIYCNEGEFAAMATVLDEYSYFIKNVVVCNASLLAEYDKSDDGTDSGVWKSRIKLKLDAHNLTEQLNMPEKTIYLGISEECE